MSGQAWAVVATFQEGVSGYAGTDDTNMYEDQPNTNYGTGTGFNLVKESGAYTNYGLFKFDISTIPSNATVSSAVLDLYMTNTHDCSDTLSVHRVLKPWTEAIDLIVPLTSRTWPGVNEPIPTLEPTIFTI